MKKEYEAPLVVTYSEDEIVELLDSGTDLFAKPLPDLFISSAQRK